MILFLLPKSPKFHDLLYFFDLLLFFLQVTEEAKYIVLSFLVYGTDPLKFIVYYAYYIYCHSL